MTRLINKQAPPAKQKQSDFINALRIPSVCRTFYLRRGLSKINIRRHVYATDLCILKKKNSVAVCHTRVTLLRKIVSCDVYVM